MLSRGKLVQDWRRRLAAAEAEDQEEHRLRWLYRMRVRLYRFLLSCYRQGDWRADEASTKGDETFADVPHGDTTTLLDVTLDGKPAKNPGKMLAVLKSVSAAQDHPPLAGPLIHGIAEDEWIVAASARDKLKLPGCVELLRHFGIASTCTKSELKVRHFDLDRAVRLIRSNRDGLKLETKPDRPWISPRMAPAAEWPVRLAVLMLFLAPIYAICFMLAIQCLLASGGQPIFDGSQLPAMLAVCYLWGIGFGVLQIWLQHSFHRQCELREARKLAELEERRGQR
jgi:hypothetical protein